MENALPSASPTNAILEATLYVDNIDRAAWFYGEVLQLEEVTRVEGRHIFFRVGQTILLIFNPMATAEGPSDPRLPVPAHGARGPGHLCFSVCAADIDAWSARLDAAGQPIEANFTWPNGARSIYFRDPAGNSLELAEPALWS